jgi:signal transduction histidine kinase
MDNQSHNHSEENSKDLWMEQFSHQLIAPLSGLEATAESLVRNYKNWDDDRILNRLIDIQSMARWAVRLARNISWQARSESTSEITSLTRWTNLKSFLLDCIKDIEAIARSRGIDIYLDSKFGDSWQILVDRELFKQAILNILDNAVKYAFTNTKVIIRASLSESNLTIGITDYGIAIEKQDAENIFKKGFRSKSAMERVVVGTGTGLSVTKEIVQLHGGNIDFSSSKSRQDSSSHVVTFNVTLPQSNVQF